MRVCVCVGSLALRLFSVPSDSVLIPSQSSFAHNDSTLVSGQQSLPVQATAQQEEGVGNVLTPLTPDSGVETRSALL